MRTWLARRVRPISARGPAGDPGRAGPAATLREAFRPRATAPPEQASRDRSAWRPAHCSSVLDAAAERGLARRVASSLPRRSSALAKVSEILKAACLHRDLVPLRACAFTASVPIGLRLPPTGDRAAHRARMQIDDWTVREPAEPLAESTHHFSKGFGHERTTARGCQGTHEVLPAATPSPTGPQKRPRRGWWIDDFTAGREILDFTLGPDARTPWALKPTGDRARAVRGRREGLPPVQRHDLRGCSPAAVRTEDGQRLGCRAAEAKSTVREHSCRVSREQQVAPLRHRWRWCHRRLRILAASAAPAEWRDFGGTPSAVSVRERPARATACDARRLHFHARAHRLPALHPRQASGGEQGAACLELGLKMYDPASSDRPARRDHHRADHQAGGSCSARPWSALPLSAAPTVCAGTPP